MTIAVTTPVFFVEDTATDSVAGTVFAKINESSGATKQGNRYICIVRALINSSSLTNGEGVQIKVYDESNAVFFSDSHSIRNPQRLDKEQGYTFATVFNCGKDNGKIEIYLAGESTNTGYCEYSSVLLFDVSELVEGVDYFVEEDSTETTHTNSYVDRVSATLQLPSSGIADGDWLILSYARFDSYNAANVNGTLAQITASTAANNTVSIAGQEIRQENEYTTEFDTDVLATVYSVAYVASPATTSATFKLQSKDDGAPVTGNHYMSSRIIGLRLDSFEDAASSYDEAAYTQSGFGFKDDLTVTVAADTSEVKDILVIGSFTSDLGIFNSSLFLNIESDGGTAATVDVMDADQKNFTTNVLHNATDELPAFGFGVVEIEEATGTNTITLQFKKSDSSDIGIKHRTLACFRINAGSRNKERRVWTGARDNNVAESENWLPVGVPTTADDLLFNSGSVDATTGTVAPAAVYIGGSYSGSVEATFQTRKLLVTSTKATAKFAIEGGHGWRNGTTNAASAILWDTNLVTDSVIVVATSLANTQNCLVRHARGRVQVADDGWGEVVSFGKKRGNTLVSGDNATIRMSGSGRLETTGTLTNATVAGRCQLTVSGELTNLYLLQQSRCVWQSTVDGSFWYLYDGFLDLTNLVSIYTPEEIKNYNAKIDARNGIDALANPTSEFAIFGRNAEIVWDRGTVVTPS